MKKSVSLFVFLFISLFVTAQNSQEHFIRINILLKKYFEANNYQKLYLHLDKSVYFVKDTLWFKSYLINVFDNNLDSTNLIYFLDFIDEHSHRQERFIVESKKGIGFGSIIIPEKLHSGNWQIVAYTQNMKNLSEDFFFRENIFLVNSSKNDSIIKSYKYLPKYKENSIIRKSKRYEVSSYWIYEPQTDDYKLILEVKNKLDNAVNLNGVLIQNGQKTDFITEENGLVELSGIKNPAEIRVQIQHKNIKLSQPKNDINKLSVVSNESFLSIYKKESVVNQRFLGIFSSGHLIQLFDLAGKKLENLQVPKDSLSEGMNWFCLLSNSYEILAIKPYLFQKENGLKLNITKDKLTFSLQNIENAKLSLSIFREPLDEKYEQNSIFTSFNRDQELKNYFSSSIMDIYNYKSAIDYSLLLKQNWSKPKFKDINELVVEGKIVRIMNFGIPDKTVRLTNSEDYFNTGVQQTSKGGRFSFKIDNLVDSAYLLIDAAKEKGPNNLAIQLDTVGNVTINYKTELTLPLDASKFQQFFGESYKAWVIENTQLIDLIKKRNELRAKSNGSIYSSPDYVIKIDERFYSYTNLMDIVATAPGVTMISGIPVIRGVSSFFGSIAPLVLVDNSPTNIDILYQLSPMDVERIEILKSPSNISMFGSRGGNGVISIFTRQGVFNTAFSYHISMPGFPMKRQFVEKSGDELLSLNIRPSATYLWIPEIQIKDHSFEIPNKKAYKNCYIRVEGLSKTGKLIFFQQKL